MWDAVESIIAEHLFDWVWEEVEYRIVSSAKWRVSSQVALQSYSYLIPVVYIWFWQCSS